METHNQCSCLKKQDIHLFISIKVVVNISLNNLIQQLCYVIIKLFQSYKYGRVSLKFSVVNIASLIIITLYIEGLWSYRHRTQWMCLGKA